MGAEDKQRRRTKTSFRRSRPLHIATEVNNRKKATSAYKCPRNEFDSPRTLAHSAATSWALLVGQTNGAALCLDTSQEADFVDISVSVRLSPRLAAGTSCVTCLATSSYFVLPLLGLATIRHATRRDGLNYR